MVTFCLFFAREWHKR